MASTKVLILMWNYFLENSLLSYSIELMAALAGSFYLSRVPEADKMVRLFVYYLWLTLFVEILGFYAAFAYFNNYEILWFIKDTGFERNFWLYNSFKVVTFLMYFLLFYSQLNNERVKRFFYTVFLLFTIISVINYIVSDVFFRAYAAFTPVTGTIILMLIIAAYYFEMLKSDRILNFYRSVVFYISVGSLFWHLVVTPLFIYSHYFSMDSPAFVSLHALLLKLANIFMYTCFTIGFLVCSRRKNSYLSSIL